MWPTLKASKLWESTYVDFVEQLQRCKNKIPPSSGRISVDSIIADVIRLVIQKATFAPYTRPSATYHHQNTTAASSAHQNRARTLELLRLCIETGNQPLCTLAFKRLLDPAFHSQEYIKNVLVPFIPELRQFLDTNGIALADAPFNDVSKSIVMLWATKVLGSKPSEVADTVMAGMRNHACKCVECERAFTFLTGSGVEKTCPMYRIGAQRRKHVEQELNKYVPRTAVTWSTIPGSPQGLLVCHALYDCAYA